MGTKGIDLGRRVNRHRGARGIRHFFFPVPMISQVLLFRRIMHCKFLVFLLIVFFFFSFFSSACEFRLIKTIGAHGKQNPDFIIINRRWASLEYPLRRAIGSVVHLLVLILMKIPS